MWNADELHLPVGCNAHTVVALRQFFCLKKLRIFSVYKELKFEHFNSTMNFNWWKSKMTKLLIDYLLYLQSLLFQFLPMLDFQ